MGRRCGWLALKAAVACGVDWVFIPEKPASLNWKEDLVKGILQTKQPDKRCSLIIVAEGAQDENFQRISSQDVHKVMTEAGADTRITILGHIQRGGSPTYYDRASVSFNFDNLQLY